MAAAPLLAAVPLAVAALLVAVEVAVAADAEGVADSKVGCECYLIPSQSVIQIPAQQRPEIS